MAYKDKEKEKENKRRYYETHKEKIAEQKRQYREANKERIREYRKANREKIAEQRRQYQHKYYEANKEKLAERNRKYYETNKEKLAEQMQQYYEAHKEKITEYKRQWNEANKERIAEQKRQRYNTPLGRANVMVSHFRREDSKRNRGECTITPDWIMENIFTQPCHYCGETDWHKLGCDRKDNNLPHTPENVVCACATCNSKRGTIPFDEFVKRLKNSEPLLKKNRPDCSKPVIACNPETFEIVYEFPSTQEAGRNGYDSGSVSAACRGCYGYKKNSHIYKGLLWFYK